MGLLSPILRNSADKRLTWWCPGCNRAHQVPAVIQGAPLAAPDATDPDWTPPREYYEARDGAWTWNGSAARPTFMPSVLVTYNGADANQPGRPPAVCHSFVVDGQMQMLGDCTHALAGQTVPIPPWPASWGEA
jgi:Family of unknown function (DUF6527)